MATTEAGVYRHVVLFKFRDATPAAQILAIESAFRDLCARLPFVKAFEFGRNSSPENLNQGFSHCFIVTFSEAGGRDEYLPHPLHQAFCREWLDPHVERVCVVDFEPVA